MTIRVLGREVAERIAAGEVIEHPAAVVKELFENALDAGARRIDIDLEQGGKTRIVVQDDGGGIAPEDVAHLFHRHATSKIRAVEDLETIRTYGFRGEALASIGAVARVIVRSAPAGAAEGREAACDEGSIREPRPVGTPPGTRVEVTDLFHSTPARRKFLRGASAELSRTLRLVARLAVPRREVAVRVRHGRALVMHLPATEDLLARIRGAFGGRVAASLVPLHAPAGHESPPPVRIEGLLSRLDRSYPDSRQIHFWVNGRAVQDRGLLAEVRRAYRGRLVGGGYPAVFLLLEIAPSAVDVNVHPAKTEVRFAQAGAVRAELQAALRRSLDRADLAPRPLAPPRGSEGRRDTPLAEPRFPDLEDPGTEPVRIREGGEAPRSEDRVREHRAAPEGAPTQDRSPAGASPLPELPPGTRWMQVRRSYVIVEDERGIVILDPHAIHERVLLEELRRQVRDGSVARQKLLIPEVLELSPAEFQRAAAARETFGRLGLEVEPFGENTVVLRALPVLARSASGRVLLEAALSVLAEGVPPGADLLLEEAMARLACAGAVKLGEAMGEEQLRHLLGRARETPSGHTCAHGRPAFLRITLGELAMRFHRHGAFAKGATLE